MAASIILINHSSPDSHKVFFTVRKYRGSRPEVFGKKGANTNLAKFTGKHLRGSLFLIKPAALLKKRLRHISFSLNIYFTGLPRTAVSRNMNPFYVRFCNAVKMLKKPWRWIRNIFNACQIDVRKSRDLHEIIYLVGK